MQAHQAVRREGAVGLLELRVQVKVPGLWFEGLSGGDRAKEYECEAFGFKAVHRFPKMQEGRAGGDDVRGDRVPLQKMT